MFTDWNLLIVLLPDEGVCTQVTHVIGYDGQPGITKLKGGLVQQVDLTKVQH